MDIDRFLALNRPAWDRLADLTSRAHRGVSRLSAPELDELIRLYQRTSAHLSYARTYYRDPGLTARLTRAVAAAGAVIYGTRPRTLRSFTRFFSSTFPAAVWHSRRFVLVSFLLLMLPALAAGAWLGTSDVALEAAGPAAAREQYLNEDFEAYYSSDPAGQFATQVTTNNIQVAITAFAAGILFCVGTAWILISNGAGVGFAGGLFVNAGQADKFFGLILPHGLLELTAVIIAGAAGLKLGWALIDPGDRTRAEALTEEGRRAIVIVLGLVLVFITAGLIEGFITGSGLPTYLRVGVGVAVELAFLTYIAAQGIRATRRGLTGAIGEDADAGWAVVAPGAA